MKQKLKDLQLVLQSSRKAKVMVFLGLLCLLYLFFGAGPQQRVRVTKGGEKKTQTNLVPQRENTDDIITRFGQDVELLKKQNEDARKDLLEQKEQLTAYEQRTAEILKKMLERMSEQQAPDHQQQVSAVDVGEPPSSSAEPQGEDSLEPFGLDEPEIAPPAQPAPKKVAFVGAGDSVRIKLLAGVNAPTDGTPYPVVFKLISDVYGPDGSTLPLGEARLIAAAQGSLTDSRALFRLTTLNIQLPSGERKVYDVDGWVVGEDGIRGMQGLLIDPIGKAIGGAMMSGAIAGVGQGLAAANQRIQQDPNGGITTVVTSGDLGGFAAGRGLAAGANEWSGIIKDRLSQMTPVVQVLSGREGTAVFARSLPVEGLIEALDDIEKNESLD